MCAESNAKIRNDNVSLGLGYAGNCITLGNVGFDTNTDESRRFIDIINFKKKLYSYKKSEIIELIVQLVENGDEG